LLLGPPSSLRYLHALDIGVAEPVGCGGEIEHNPRAAEKPQTTMSPKTE